MSELKEQIIKEIEMLRKENVSDEYAEGYNDGLLDAAYWLEKLLDTTQEQRV